MLEGRVALVTGGRGGVGRAVCRRFVTEGASVYAADVSDQGSVGDPEQSPPGTFLRFDVTSEHDVRVGVATIAEQQQRLDIVVNAAGIEIERAIDETTLEDWNRIFAVNVTGTFLTCKYALPLLRRSAHASIINLGSYDGYIADPGLAAYCATKGAVHALTKAMACDHGPEGIRVNAICPGYVDTPMLRQFFAPASSSVSASASDLEPDSGSNPDAERIRAEAAALHPLRTIGTPTDMANLVNWLASDEARYATGQLWVLDGGLSAQVQQMRL